MGDCYEENTIPLNETIVNSNIDDFKSKMQVYNYGAGKLFTYFDPEHNATGDEETHFILFSNVTYFIMIHDPQYFVMTLRPQIYPGVIKRYEVMKMNQSWYLLRTDSLHRAQNLALLNLSTFL